MSGTPVDMAETSVYLWPLCWEAWDMALQLRKPQQDFEDYPVPEMPPDARLAWWQQEVESGRTLMGGLFSRSDDRLLGVVKAFDFSPERDFCEVGIEILEPANYAQGYGRIGLGLWLGYLHSQGVAEVCGLIHPENDRSLALFRRLGFTQTGIVLDPTNPRQRFVEVMKALAQDHAQNQDAAHDHAHPAMPAEVRQYHPRKPEPHERELPTLS